MTPCEKIGLKVGDEVKVTEEGSKRTDLAAKECLVLERDEGSSLPLFRSETRGLSFCLSTLGYGTETGWFEITKTEAEKRGAKFGTMGVEKATGKRCVWIGDSLVLPGYWEIDVEGKAERYHRRPEEIRLDHEPEFKDVPFHEATHDQRMISGNVRDEFGQKVDDIFWSEKREIYVILLRTVEDDIATSSSVSYTVRIPA